MKFSRLISLVLCFALLLTACACSGEKTAEKKRIAVIAKAVDSDFWHNVKNGVESAATEYNVSVTFEGPENESDYEEQNRLIKQAIDNKVDAIVLSAIDFSKSNDIVDEAARSGIKVVTIDSDVGSKNRSLFIGTDNREAGIAAAKAAVKGFDSDAAINIGLVNYNADTDNGNQREAGFREYIETVPNAKIVATVTAESNSQSATLNALSLLENNPQVNVLVGFNEWLTLGVGYAIKQTSAADRVIGIGFDTNVVSVGMIETGEMNALIVQNPFAIGYLGVEKATALISGDNVGEGDLHTDVTTVTKDNLYDDDIQKMLFRFK